MKLSAYIRKLEALLNEHGDLEVDTYGVGGDRQDAPVPEIAYRRILSNKERTPRFWWGIEAKKGEKVVRV